MNTTAGGRSLTNKAYILAKERTPGIVYIAFGGTVNDTAVLILQRTTITGTSLRYEYYTPDPGAEFATVWAGRATHTYTTEAAVIGGLELPEIGDNDTISIAETASGITYNTATTHATIGATYIALPDIACKTVTIWNTHPTTAEDMEVARGSNSTGIPLPPGTAWQFAVVANANELKIRRWSQAAGAITIYYEAIN